MGPHEHNDTLVSQYFVICGEKNITGKLISEGTWPAKVFSWWHLLIWGLCMHFFVLWVLLKNQQLILYTVSPISGSKRLFKWKVRINSHFQDLRKFCSSTWAANLLSKLVRSYHGMISPHVWDPKPWSCEQFLQCLMAIMRLLNRRFDADFILSFYQPEFSQAQISV